MTEIMYFVLHTAAKHNYLTWIDWIYSLGSYNMFLLLFSFFFLQQSNGCWVYDGVVFDDDFLKKRKQNKKKRAANIQKSFYARDKIHFYSYHKIFA